MQEHRHQKTINDERSHPIPFKIISSFLVYLWNTKHTIFQTSIIIPGRIPIFHCLVKADVMHTIVVLFTTYCTDRNSCCNNLESRLNMPACYYNS